MIDENKIQFIKAQTTDKVIYNRDEKILELVKNRSVCHVGCVGTYENGESFHSMIDDISAVSLGIDVNTTGLENLQVGNKNLDLLYGDISDDKLEIKNEFEVFLFGEVIEHLPNPGKALTNAYRALIADGYVIITVPNAFSLTNFLQNLLKSGEYVRTDHVAYYSYQTLKRLINDHGLDIEYFAYYSHLKNKRSISAYLSNILKKFLYARRPNLAEGIFMVCRKF